MREILDFDLTKISELMSSFVDLVTCVECCELYKLPETASCGHTFCHSCWRNWSCCKVCDAALDFGKLRQNNPIQIITEHVRLMCEIFGKTFNTKVNNLFIGTKSLERSPPESPNENLQWKELEKITCTAQVHNYTRSKELISYPKLATTQTPQIDWEIIEKMSDRSETIPKIKLVSNSDVNPTQNMKQWLRRPQRHISVPTCPKSTKFISTEDHFMNSTQFSSELNMKRTNSLPGLSSQIVQDNKDKFEYESVVKQIFLIKSSPSKNFSSESSKQRHDSDLCINFSSTTKFFNEQKYQDEWDNINNFLEDDGQEIANNFIESASTTTKNLKGWLDNLDSCFTKAINTDTLQNTNTLTSTAQVHNNSNIKKVTEPSDIVVKSVTQDDWDNIEVLLDDNELVSKQKSASEKDLVNTKNNNIFSQLATDISYTENIDNFFCKDNLIWTQKKGDDFRNYSIEYPRRSPRKREYKYYAECHYYPIKRRRS